MLQFMDVLGVFIPKSFILPYLLLFKAESFNDKIGEIM